MIFTDMRVHIIGLGSLGTGQACARVLAERGAYVTISDSKPREMLTEQIASLADLAIVFQLGDDAYTDIEHADLVVPSPGVPFDIPPLQRARDAGADVVSEIEVASWIAPCPIIAVTGTKGKTTTTTLVGMMLEAAGLPVLVGGNIGTPLIQQAAMATVAHTLVAEVSSFQLEGTRTFHPKVAVFTNFFADHLDRHPDLDAYWHAKTRIFANQCDDDTAVINIDDPKLAEMATHLTSKVIPFSLSQSAYAERCDTHLCIAGRPVLAIDQIRLRGQHNIANVLAALAAVHAIGVDLTPAEDVLRSFRGVANRLEEVAVVKGVTFINDSQATIPEAVEVALEAMDAPTFLIAGGKPKVDDFSAMAERMVGKVKTLFVIGEASEMIAAAAQRAGVQTIVRAKTLPDAVRQAFAQAVPGDIILMSPACASFDMFRNMSHRGQVFRDAVHTLDQAGDA
jgi:UDP-N-acetylmuramoylalanine--D-glutamate ligase